MHSHEVKTKTGTAEVRQVSDIQEIGSLSFEPNISFSPQSLFVIENGFEEMNDEAVLILKGLMREIIGVTNSVTFVSKEAIVDALFYLDWRTLDSPYAMRIRDTGLLAVNYAQREIPG